MIMMRGMLVKGQAPSTAGKSGKPTSLFLQSSTLVIVMRAVLGDNENTRNNPAAMRLFSYHPDLPEIRKTYAKYADAVERMDEKGREMSC